MKSTITRFGENLLSGFTDVVTKPVEGAERDGASGFFKGLGQGLVGLVTKPVVSTGDLIQGTFVAATKGSSLVEEVRFTRPMRLFEPSGRFEPYCALRANGVHLAKVCQTLVTKESRRALDVENFLNYLPLQSGAHLLFFKIVVVLLSETLDEIKLAVPKSTLAKPFEFNTESRTFKMTLSDKSSAKFQTILSDDVPEFVDFMNRQYGLIQ